MYQISGRWKEVPMMAQMSLPFSELPWYRDILDSKQTIPYRQGGESLTCSNLLTAKQKRVTQFLRNPKPIMKPNNRDTPRTFLNFGKLP